MKALKIIFALIFIFMITPIWYYLLHFLLIRAGADELQMFLFWIYVPLGLLCATFSEIIKKFGDD